MRHIVVPADSSRRLVFYLAMEEWVCSRLGEGFFVWQVPPTVIFGRNQDLLSELDLRYCEEHSISFFRRKSGGGCVYSDEGNIMISCITPCRRVEDAFADYLDKLCAVLRSLGFDAVCSEHNDVLIESRKVSGNACFATEKGSIVHGTLLYDTDFNVLEKAITPSREKLEKHAVRSVRQRVANLMDLGLSMGIDELKARLISDFTDSEYLLTPSDLAEIEDIEKTYLDPDFLFGKDKP